MAPKPPPRRRHRQVPTGMDSVQATARGRRRAQETESQASRRPARPGREEDKTSLVLMSTNPRERLPREAEAAPGWDYVALRWTTSNQRLRGGKLSRRTWKGILADLCCWSRTLRRGTSNKTWKTTWKIPKIKEGTDSPRAVKFQEAEELLLLQLD